MVPRNSWEGRVVLTTPREASGVCRFFLADPSWHSSCPPTHWNLDGYVQCTGTRYEYIPGISYPEHTLSFIEYLGAAVRRLLHRYLVPFFFRTRQVCCDTWYNIPGTIPGTGIAANACVLASCLFSCMVSYLYLYPVACIVFTFRKWHPGTTAARSYFLMRLAMVLPSHGIV